MRGTLAWVLLGIALNLATLPAVAEEDRAPSAENIAAAEALFNEGQALFEAGKAREACPKFAASYRLDPGLGTLLNLARCYEAANRTASAWAAYVDLESLALRAGQSDRVAIARQRIAALLPRLMRVIVRVAPSNPPELAVTRDGKRVDEALFGVAVALDPGEHVFSAGAPGHDRWRQRLTLKQEGTTTELFVPRLERVPDVHDEDPPVVLPEPEAPAAPLPGC